MVSSILTACFPPIFSFVQSTHSNFTRGELKIGRSLDRNCQSSLPGVAKAPALLGVQKFIFTTGQDSPKFPIFAMYLPKIPKK